MQLEFRNIGSGPGPGENSAGAEGTLPAQESNAS
jgi:hypothetical protein